MIVGHTIEPKDDFLSELASLGIGERLKKAPVWRYCPLFFVAFQTVDDDVVRMISDKG